MKKFNKSLIAGALLSAVSGAVMVAPAQADPVQKPFEKCQQWPQYDLKRLPEDNCSDSKPVIEPGPYTS